MALASPLQLGLDDLLGELHYARRQGDLGRLALVAYCEVRRWARWAGESVLAERAAAIITATPHASRDAFLHEVDELIGDLQRLRERRDANAAGGDQSASSTAPQLALDALRANLPSTPRV